MNEIAKVTQKRGRARKPGKSAGMSWVDRFAGTLDEGFARGALDLPAPATPERPDLA